MVKPLSEKTLEFNVTQEMIFSLYGHSTPKPYMYGYSMRYEKKTGFDVSLDLPGGNTIVSFQYKKASAHDGNTFVFKFNNNSQNDQHNILYYMAVATRPVPTVFYALPALIDINSFEAALPNLLDRTRFVDPIHIGPINDGLPHQCHVNIFSNVCTVQSESHKEVPVLRWKDLMERIKYGDAGIKVKELKAALSDFRIDEERIWISGEPRKKRFVRLTAVVLR